MGSTIAQLLDEAKQQSLAEREQLIEQLQHGVKVRIPASESLAIKANLGLPWNQLREARRYTWTTVGRTLQHHTYIIMYTNIHRWFKMFGVAIASE